MDILFGLALSTHLGFGSGYNEIHPHARLENNSFVAGMYYNSEEKVSVYAGIEIEKERWGYEFGLVSGYGDGEIIPFIRSTYNISDKINFFITPGYETKNNEKSLGMVIGVEAWSF